MYIITTGLHVVNFCNHHMTKKKNTYALPSLYHPTNAHNVKNVELLKH